MLRWANRQPAAAVAEPSRAEPTISFVSCQNHHCKSQPAQLFRHRLGSSLTHERGFDGAFVCTFVTSTVWLNALVPSHTTRDIVDLHAQLAQKPLLHRGIALKRRLMTISCRKMKSLMPNLSHATLAHPRVSEVKRARAIERHSPRPRDTSITGPLIGCQLWSYLAALLERISSHWIV